MSVIVHGMDMPKSCLECPFETDGTACGRFPDKKSDHEIRPSWCPLERHKEPIPAEDKCPFCAGRLLPPNHGTRRCGNCNFWFPVKGENSDE